MKGKILLFSFCFLIIATSGTKAQIGLMMGPNYSSVRHNNILENSQGKINYQYGFNLAFYPISSLPELSLKTDMMVVTKGHQQNLSGENFKTNLTYLSFAPMVRYELANGFHVHSGLELNSLTSSNVNEGLQTYQNSERAVFLGFDVMADKVFSFFLRSSFGLSPMLDYYDIHPIDGIQGSMKDIYSTTVLFGLQINLYNEKIKF